MELAWEEEKTKEEIRNLNCHELRVPLLAALTPPKIKI